MTDIWILFVYQIVKSSELINQPNIIFKAPFPVVFESVNPKPNTSYERKTDKLFLNSLMQSLITEENNQIKKIDCFSKQLLKIQGQKDWINEF